MRQQQVTLLTHFSKLKNHKNQVLFQLFLSTQTNGKVKKNRQIESHYLPSTLRPKMKALTKSAAFCRLAMSRASLSILISTCLDFKLNWMSQLCSTSLRSTDISSELSFGVNMPFTGLMSSLGRAKK